NGVPGKEDRAGQTPGPHVHFFAESGGDWVALGQPPTSVQTYYDYVLVSGNMVAVGRMGDMVVDLYHYDESKMDINEIKDGEDWSLNKYVNGLAQVSSLPAVGRVSFYGETRLAAFNGYGAVSIHSIDGQKELQIIRSNSTGFGRNIDSDDDLLMISSDGQVHLYSENETGLFEELLTLDLDYGSYRLSGRNLLVVNGGNSSIHTIDISECIPSADISTSIPSILVPPSETSQPTPIPSISKAVPAFSEAVSISFPADATHTSLYEVGGNGLIKPSCLRQTELHLASLEQSVAIHEDTIVVGAEGYGDDGDRSGSAHVFVRSGGKWTQQAKLLASDGAEYDRFGESVAIHKGYYCCWASARW
ncbi:hypothetical protein THAOC_36758, partial [Thalassiosira oceanica]